jgi:hypothetical protein
VLRKGTHNGEAGKDLQLTESSHINVLPVSRERRASNSVQTELNVGTTLVPLVGCSGVLGGRL